MWRNKGLCIVVDMSEGRAAPFAGNAGSVDETVALLPQSLLTAAAVGGEMELCLSAPVARRVARLVEMGLDADEMQEAARTAFGQADAMQIASIERLEDAARRLWGARLMLIVAAVLAAATWLGLILLRGGAV